MSAGCREVDRNCKTRYRWRCCSQHRPRTLIPDITLVNIAETFSTGRFLPKIETIFSSARRQCIVAGKHFNFFFSSSFLSYDLLPSMYRHDSDGSRTPLRERTNRQRRKARKFLWTTISLPRYTDWYSWKKTILRWNDISFKLLNLKNIRLNESLIARKKIASYPLNNNYDSEEKIKNLIYIPTCTSRYIKTGK